MNRPILLALILLLAACGEARDERPTLQVAVASNFRDTALELAERFEAKHGCEVVISSGSTGRLFSQIENGAPFEVFLAADHWHAEQLTAKDPKGFTRLLLYATGRLVLAARDGQPAPALEIISRCVLPRDHRLAIANGLLAPYGKAAENVLLSRGYWSSPNHPGFTVEEEGLKVMSRDHLAIGESVGQTAHFLLSGGVDLALLPLSVALEKGLPHSLIEEDDARVPQYACAAANSRIGQDFLDYLQSDEARAIIVKAGYEVEER